MTTVVAYSWARSADSALVRADGTVDWRSTRMSAGEDDHAAVAVALSLAAEGDDVVGVTLGDADASWALARGVARAVCITDVPPLDDEAATGAALAAAVRTVPGADVVVVGDAEEHPMVTAALAGGLGWPVVLGVTSAGTSADGIVAVRPCGDVDEVLTLTPPVVLGVRAQAAEARAPGMKEMLTARKRPVERLSSADVGLVLPAAPTSLGTRVPERVGAQLLPGDADEAARALVAALRTEGVL